MVVDRTLFFILLFLAVFIISQALLLPAAGQKAKHKELAKRLKKTKGESDVESINLLNEHYNKSLSPLDRRLVEIPYFANLKKVVELAGIKMSLGDIILRTAFACVIGFVLIIVIGKPWYFGIVLSLLTLFSVYFYINYRVNDRLSKFEEQLPEALDIMRRMLSAGKPLTEAFKEVGEELPSPAGEEFLNTFNLLNFGYDMRVAILNMADRVPTISMMAFSSAVLLQKDTGGNLSENLQKVSEVLRARFKLSRKIKTLTAESRLSAWILVLAPFGLFGMISYTNPSYLESLYTDPSGLKLIGIGMISLIIGAFVLRKMITIEV